MQSEVFFVENDIHRRDKTNYYLDLAEAVSQRCTCLRRHYGAVIVKNDEVISTGYVGAPRGRKWRTQRLSAGPLRSYRRSDSPGAGAGSANSDGNAYDPLCKVYRFVQRVSTAAAGRRHDRDETVWQQGYGTRELCSI